MTPEELARARKSVCVRCARMSIWHVEFENRICARSMVPPDVVLRGIMDECPNIVERRTFRKDAEYDKCQRGITITKPKKPTNKEKVKRFRRKRGQGPLKRKKWVPPEDRQ